MKLLLFAEEYPFSTNYFYPLYDDVNRVIGTQWLTAKFNLQLANFKHHDYTFHTEITSSGYKRYSSEEDPDYEKYLLVESRLSDKFL